MWTRHALSTYHTSKYENTTWCSTLVNKASHKKLTTHNHLQHLLFSKISTLLIIHLLSLIIQKSNILKKNRYCVYICKKWDLNANNAIYILLLICSVSQPDEETVGSKHIPLKILYILKVVFIGYLFNPISRIVEFVLYIQSDLCFGRIQWICFLFGWSWSHWLCWWGS